MTKQSTKNENGNSFEYRLREVSDEEIISILRYKEHFQKKAVKAAVKEALLRGIINSVDDLEKKEFQPQPLQPKTIFPLGTSDAYTFGIFKSLCRISYGFGLLPIIYAVFQFMGHNFINGISASIAGLAIFFIVFKLEKTFSRQYSNYLLLLNIPAAMIALLHLQSLGSPTIMDGFAIMIVIVVILYVTFYLRKLTRYFHNKNNVE
ncbi:MAG TPA: hypothetical protein VJ909_02070 [Prolixibacteraceae bacterium]|nr:hypothetical protein [Prolixibacteraceae bacterium]